MTVAGHRSVFRSRVRGSAAVEYITALVLVGISCIIAFKAFGTKVKCKMAIASAKLDGSDPPAECADTQVASNDPTPGGDSCPSGSCMIPGGSCFIAGTLVLTESGEQPIETVREGDRVLARDELTGAVELQTVTRTFVTPDMPLVDVQIVRGTNNNGGDDDVDVVTATPGHLFWTADRGWTRAEQLAPGEPLIDASGATLHVGQVRSLDHDDVVYNFEVARTHTYFVGALATWVHNPYNVGDPVVVLQDGEADSPLEGTVTSTDPLKIMVTSEFGEPADPPYEYKVPKSDVVRPGKGAAKPPRSSGPATITHYSPPGLPGRGSEYVQPGGPVIITSHGIGSGVYGVDGVSGADPQSTPHQITMQNPYHLQDPAHSNSYTSTSTSLQGLANTMQHDPGIAGNPNPTPEQIQNSMNQHPQQVQTVLNNMHNTFGDDPGYDQANNQAALNSALGGFLGAYNGAQPGDSVPQPINFLIGNQGHDGVYATPSSGYNGWAKGSVAFNPPPGFNTITQPNGCR
ncbi:MAG TPA: polymorphic toxin-type HINT domain-containing protein [Polyangia bacterium]|nr:polymorphic toxin-type HINT domain-containing protein [Polyangia bacterium]